MKIRDYIAQHESYYIAPEVQHASEYLERHGEILFVSFNFYNAIDKAAEMFTIALDEAFDWTEIRRIVRSGEIHPEWT